MLKVGAIGGIFALRFALVRRSKAKHEDAAPDRVEAARPARREPHPVSRKKKRRRRR